MKTAQREHIAQHGRDLLAIFPNATERDPVELCRKLRRLEAKAAKIGLRLSNGPEYEHEDDADKESDAILAKVNTLLGNKREYQPKTGAKCGCRRGIQRDNCPNCEGTGYAIDFRTIRNAPPVVPIFVNRDPRGHALKIRDEWVYAAQSVCRDGEPVYTGPDPEAWLHRQHSYSVQHATEHEGYTIEPARLHRDWGGYGILAPEIND